MFKVWYKQNVVNEFETEQEAFGFAYEIELGNTDIEFKEGNKVFFETENGINTVGEYLDFLKDSRL